MRADRLLSILLLLQAHQRMTAGDLARRLEVSERTIYRDMDALSGAGIPVLAERGSGGGWFLMEDYRTNLTGLTNDEIQVLFLTGSPRLLTDLGLRQASETALVKLLAALPTTRRRDAEYISQRIYVDSAGWRPVQEDVTLLPTLQKAIWQEQRVQLTYRRGDGSEVERRVDPLGLVAKGNVWYLVAAVEGDVRTYRVSRVQRAEQTDETCPRPQGFDLATYWEQSSIRFLADLPRYPAMLRVKHELFPHLGRLWRFARIGHADPADADGWVRVAVQFEVEEEACQYVLSVGPQVEVLEPVALRQKVLDLAEGVVVLYKRAGGRSTEPEEDEGNRCHGGQTGPS